MEEAVDDERQDDAGGAPGGGRPRGVRPAAARGRRPRRRGSTSRAIPTLKGIMGAKKKEIKDVKAADLGLAAEPPALSVVKLEALPAAPARPHHPGRARGRGQGARPRASRRRQGHLTTVRISAKRLSADGGGGAMRAPIGELEELNVERHNRSSETAATTQRDDMAGAFWSIVEDDRQGESEEGDGRGAGRGRAARRRRRAAQAEAVWLTDKATPEGLEAARGVGRQARLAVRERRVRAVPRRGLDARSLAELAGKESPQAIFAPVTTRQRELMARLAARLGAGLVGRLHRARRSTAASWSRRGRSTRASSSPR